MRPTNNIAHRRSLRGADFRAAADAPFPIVAYLPANLEDGARDRAEQLARALLCSEPRLSATDPFGEQVRTGIVSGPCVFIEDHYAIRLFERLGNQAYSYRMLLLARPGDVVLIGGYRSEAFEGYCATRLGFGSVEILEPPASARLESLASRCARDPALIGRLAAIAREHGAISIVPYMGSGGVWAMAGAVAARAGVPVHVCAPPPRLTRRVNDKIWFGQCVDRLIGQQAMPSAWPVSSTAMLAARVALLARDHPSLVIKLPDSASAKGNFLIDATRVIGCPLRELRDWLLKALREAGWLGSLPVLVSAWEQPVLMSPSVHLWIPPAGEGDPIVEAIFEQHLGGAGGAFSGAAPATLPANWQQRLAGEAALLGVLFQRLGYVGRCSFDAILVGWELADAALHWIECNGRWGGVSLPLTVAARLFGDWRTRPFVIAEQTGWRGPAQDLREIIAALDDELFISGGRQEGAVILSPAPMEWGSGYELMVFAEAAEIAREHANRIDGKLRHILEPAGR